MNTVGENIKKYREAKKLTQAQFAEILGMSPITVTMWETGKRRPYARLEKIADALGVSVALLLGYGDCSDGRGSERGETMNSDKYNASGAYDPVTYAALEKVSMEEEARKWPLVYICAPLAGNVKRNLANAKRYSRFASMHGAVVFTPHFYAEYLDDDVEKERNLAICMNERMLKLCDEVWVFGKRISPGMKDEIRFAERRGIKVKYFNEGCREVTKSYSERGY